MADNDPIDADVPYEQEPMPVEDLDQPRRAASARFEVDAQIGSEATLREAMDPANQSLADALRLSFKVLQVVILVLVALFLVSSCKTVGEDQSGVFTRWGKVVPLGDERILAPGLKWGRWPYPIGEFVLFRDANRTADVGDVFAWQTMGLTQQDLLERADANNPLNPGRDGSLVTADGDLMHMKISARYSIENPTAFVQQVNDADPRSDANRLVRLALQQAAVAVSAMHTRAELSGRPDEPQALIKDRAQQILSSIKCGIRIDSVSVKDNIAPLAIEKIAGDLTEAEQDVRTQVQNAIKTANDTLISVAGEEYRELVRLIDLYEEAMVRNDNESANRMLAEINARLEDPKTTGKVSEIIGQARAYRVQVEGSLGTEAQRFESVLPAFRDHPELFVRQKWMEAFAAVVRRPDAEIIYVPAGVLAMQLNLSGSAQVEAERRKNYFARKQREADVRSINPAMPYIMRGSDITGGEGRQLQEDVRGRLMPTGSGEMN